MSKAICPNVNTEEWTALVDSVGEFEAYRDFFETDGDIRSPKIVQEKIDTRTTGRTSSLGLSQRLSSFLNSLNVTVEFKEELQSGSGYNALSLTDLINKYVAIRNDYMADGLLKETAYVAYSFLGKRNKIRTDLTSSIENIENYKAIYKEYADKSPTLSEYKIKELIIVDFLADALKNNFEAPRDSYQNRKADYWMITGNSKLEKQIKYHLGKFMRYVKEFFKMGKLSKTEIDALLDDIANDVLHLNFAKFGTKITPDQQLTNYETTIAGDKKANAIVEHFKGLGLLLTGSLALRKEGTIYRSVEENLHDLDFTVQWEEHKEFFDELWADFEDSTKYSTQIGKYVKWRSFDKKLNQKYAKHPLIASIKKKYPSFELVKGFKGLRPGEVTLTGDIDGYAIDLFFIRNEENLGTLEKGFQDWIPIFKAKINMGRDKDIRDFANYVPFNMLAGQVAQEPGFRHFTFGSINNNLADLNRVRKNQPAMQPELARDVDVTYGVDSLMGQAILNDAVDNSELPLGPVATSHIRALELAQKMSDMLGIDFQSVTPEEARELTKNASNPWTGEPAFFVGGRVYFVGQHMTTNSVFHEFAHPFLRHLAATNPKLFQNLYNQLTQSETGQQILAGMREEGYGNSLKEGSNMWMEEALVRSLTMAGMNKLNNLKEESKFSKFINNMLYAIKQIMRKLFGSKSDVAKLSPTTTIDELADMLMKGDKISIDTENINQEDIVAYNKERAEFVESLEKVEENDIQRILNKMYEVGSNHINKLLSNRNYDALAEILTDEDQRGDLQELKSNLQAYQTAVSTIAGKKLADMADTTQRATALMNGIYRLDIVMEKIQAHIADIQKEGETQDNLHKAYHYSHLINHWQQFLDEAKATMGKDVPSKSPVRTLIASIETNIQASRESITEMYATGARDTLYDELLPMHQNIKTRYDKMIKDLEDRPGAPQSKIDSLYKEYHGITKTQQGRLNELAAKKKTTLLSEVENNEMNSLQRDKDRGIALSPEKIERMLKGELGDANWFNSYLEGYLYNTDPVIGGLASYVKNKMNEVMVKAQAKYNIFSEDMAESLDAAGYNPINPAGLGEKLGFLDIIAKKDPATGAMVKHSIWTFLNPFKHYRYDYNVHRDTVEKAQLKYQQDGTDAAKQAMLDAIKNRQAFMRTYFNQQYVPEFYERDELFEKDDIGVEAMYRRKEWAERYRTKTEGKTLSQELEMMDEIDEMWKEYRQMRSLYTLQGKHKTGLELDIAKRIQDYHEASLEFYENKPRVGAFDGALRAYEQELLDGSAGKAGIERDSDEFKALRALWIKKNTQRVPNDAWYAWRSKLYKEMSDIYAKLRDKNDPQALEDETQLMDDIFDLMGGFKDDYGQTVATELSPESRALIRQKEYELIELRKSGVGRNGLTQAQNEELNRLKDLKAAGQWSYDLQKEMNALYDLMKDGLTKSERKRLENIKEELLGESKRIATDYYVDTLNEFLSKLTVKNKLHKVINKATADLILEPRVLKRLLGQNAEFDTWFEENHILKERFNKELGENGEMEQYWVRSIMWSSTVPTDESHFETTEIKDASGEVSEVIQGKPIKKYFSRVVKQEYRTEKIVGVTVDNQYNWLPKSKADMAKVNLPDAERYKYINEDYYRLEADDPKHFKVLKKLTEHHLRNQEGISHSGRLYLDYPRYRKNNLELIQSKNLFQNLVERIKDFWRFAKDDADSGYNQNDEFDLIRMDMFDNEITSVPIHGLFDIDHQDVSTDITHTMMKYMLSGERQKQLVAISPIARAIQTVVNEKANKPNYTNSRGLEAINKSNFLNSAIKTYKKIKGDGIRAKAVNNFLAREFEGERMTGLGSDSKWLNSTASLLFKRASFSFFALNFASALKNSYGAKFQGMIEASAGEHMSHISFQKGNVWSYATMAELSFGGQLYKKGARSLRQQIVEIFDPAQGRFEERFGEGMSRTIAADVAGMNWLYNFRRWVELQATLQIFGGMMHHKKIEQTMPDGTVKEIDYIDAWEKKGDRIQLKEGIDPTWGITYNEDGELQMGDKFSRYKNTVHQVMNNLQGAYADFDQPEAQRYLAFRFLSYLRRYFTTMTMNRFGFSGRWGDPQPRLNPGLGDAQTGFYITFLKTLKETIGSLGQNLMYMTPVEKRAALKVLTEVALLVVTNLAAALLFGWDPDDDEKFEKLRAKSGPLPFPMVSEDPERPFNGWGYAENHMLFLLMNIRGENEQFLPLPGYGLDDYSAMLDLKSIAFGPTAQTYVELLNDAIDILSNDDSAYYKRKMGPYTFQDEGGAKLWSHLGRTFGLTGSILDPAKAVKGFESVRARAR